MVEPTSELECRVGALDGGVGEAEQPQAEGGRGQTRDPRVVAHPGPERPCRARLEQRDRTVKVAETLLEPTGEHERRTQDEETVDPHARVVLALGQLEDLAAELVGLVELGPQEVQAGEPAQDREMLAILATSFEQVERALVGVGDLRSEAPGRQERPSEAHPQGDLLPDELGRRRRLGEDGQQVRGELDRVLVPAARLVQDQQAVGQLGQLTQIRLGDPVPPGQAEVVDLGDHRSHGLVASDPRQVPAQPGGAVGVVGRVAAADRGTCRALVEPLGGVFADRLEHQHPRFTVRGIDLPDQTLFEERRERLDDVDLDPGLGICRSHDLLDRAKVRVGEDRE